MARVEQTGPNGHAIPSLACMIRPDRSLVILGEDVRYEDYSDELDDTLPLGSNGL